MNEAKRSELNPHDWFYLLFMKTITYYECPHGRIKLSKQLAGVLSERQKIANGDGRKKDVKQARCDFDFITDALDTLSFRYFDVTGENELDLSV